MSSSRREGEALRKCGDCGHSAVSHGGYSVTTHTGDRPCRVYACGCRNFSPTNEFITLEYSGPAVPAWFREGVQVKLALPRDMKKYGLRVHGNNNYLWGGEQGTVQRVDGEGWWSYRVDFIVHGSTVEKNVDDELIQYLKRGPKPRAGSGSVAGFAGIEGGEEMQTIHDFIRQFGLRMTSRENHNYGVKPGDEWGRSASHWICTLSSTKSRGSISVEYHMGSAHTGEPEIEGVLDSLKLDASSYLNARDYEDFCSEFGYEPNEFNEDTGRTRRNPKAWTVWTGCAAADKKLKSLLGESAYRELREETESL